VTTDEYKEWTKFHRDLFQMKAAEDAAMFAAWFGSLAEFAIGEAKEASIAIASDPTTAGRFRTEHLSLIRLKVKAKRSERMKAEFAELDRQRDAGTCGVCGGCGIVSVPHPNSVLSGTWNHPFYELSVGCDCARGIAWFNAMGAACRERNEKPGARKIDIMDLRTYEAIHPNWRGMVDERNRQRAGEREAEYHARKADKAEPISAASVAEQLRKLKEGIGAAR